MATGLLAGALTIVGIAHAPAAGATDDVTSERLAGATRYGTAAAVSADAAFEGATSAILATGENFPDALAASGLAGSNPATPILLTQSDELSNEALAALDDLAVDEVTVVGGTAAVSDDVVTSLEDNGYTVTRVAGTDRYGTAAAIAGEMGAVGEVDGLVSALIATGENYPDALAGGPVAYDANLPILLINSDGVPAETEAALSDLGIEQAILLGGTAAVSDDTAADLASMTGNDVVRLAGVNRFGTAAAIGDFEIDTLGFNGPDYILTTGVNFPDALSAGPLGGQLRAPIVLTASLPDESADFLDRHSDILSHQIVVGGTAAVDEDTAAAGEAAAESTDNDTPTGGDTTTSSLVGPELQSASISGIDLDELAISYDFVFDTNLDEDVVNPDQFLLYNSDTSDGGTAPSSSNGAVFDGGDQVDVSGDTVSVVFNLGDKSVANATLAAVTEGAVEDPDGNINPAQSVKVSGIGNSAGNGIVSAEVSDAESGLVTITYASPQVPGGQVGSLFELITREGVTLTGTQADAAETAAGGEVSAENVPQDDELSTTVEVTFECNGDQLPTQYTDSDGDADATNDPCQDAADGDAADLSNLNLRRLVERSLTTGRMSDADLGSGGITNAPDLVDVQTASDNADLEDNEALFIFDEAIDTLGAVPSAYKLLYATCQVTASTTINTLIAAADTADGDATYETQDGQGFDDTIDFAGSADGCTDTPTSVVLGASDDDEFSNRSVLATFDNDTIDNDFLIGGQVNGASLPFLGITPAAVSEEASGDLTNDSDVVFTSDASSLFDDGEVAGPQLIDATIQTHLDFSGDFSDATVILTFDKNLDDDTALAGSISYFYEEAGAVESDEITLGDCSIEDDVTIECTIDSEDDTIFGATVISVEFGTVLGDDTFTLAAADEGIQFPNPEASAPLTELEDD